jgi:hypothetical protein
MLNGPRIGEIVYLDIELYLKKSRGVRGGKTKISSIMHKDDNIWVKTEIDPKTFYLWEGLLEQQEFFENKFGDSWAKVDSKTELSFKNRL